MSSKTICGIVLALILCLGLFGIALAHAKLASSDPKDGAQLDKVPAKITLVFSEEIEADQSSFTVTNAKGTTVGAGKLDLNDLDHKTLSGTMDPNAGNGVYTVKWVAVTPDDNAKEEGTISFTVGAVQAQPTATLKPTVQATVAQPTAATQPTTAPRPTTAAQPTAAPSNLPNTSNGTQNTPGWLLGLVGIALLIGALIAWRVTLRKRH